MIRSRRKKPRRGQPTPKEKGALREQVYAESGGMCELNKHPKHIAGRLPFDGDVFQRWHLVHIKAKRVHGWGRENLCGGCFWCHSIALHQYGLSGTKPVPGKVDAALKEKK